MSTEINLPKVVYVQVNDKKVAVKKLGLLKYSQLTSSINIIINSVVEFFQKQEELKTKEDMSALEKRSSVTNLITNLVVGNIEAVARFLDTCIPDLGYEYILEEVGVDDVVTLAGAILEVNNINGAYEAGKKLISGLLRANLNQ